ncbi:phasin family protein [Salinarimonas rosea]|uniref:phasin family protein n=1 Tax=Salinarimonas rosea TaxID=552063 RepID=UPI000404EE7B|nr:phasin family protein [Salinarimonas rosea]
MANERSTTFEIPAEMREMAERSVEQARMAMEGFVSAAARAMESFDAPAERMGMNPKDMREKTFGMAEANLKASFEHAQKMIRAKDPAEAMKLQMEFMQAQFVLMQEQMRQLGVDAGAAMKQAGDAATAATTQAGKAAPTGGPAKKA